MAWNTPIAYDGTTLTYHKIISVNADFISQNKQIVVASYVDQPTRMAGVGEYLATWNITVNPSIVSAYLAANPNTLPMTDTRQLLYPLIAVPGTMANLNGDAQMTDVFLNATMV